MIMLIQIGAKNDILNSFLHLLKGVKAMGRPKNIPVIRERLEEVLKRRNITKYRLAAYLDSCGVIKRRAFMYALKNSAFSSETLRAVAIALNASIEYLTGAADTFAPYVDDRRADIELFKRNHDAFMRWLHTLSYFDNAAIMRRLPSDREMKRIFDDPANTEYIDQLQAFLITALLDRMENDGMIREEDPMKKLASLYVGRLFDYYLAEDLK